MGDKPQKVKKLRSTRACISCRIRKIRCDAQERIPCSNCAPLGLTCKFVEPKSRKKKQRILAPTPPTPPMQWPPQYYANPYAAPQYYPYPAPLPMQRVSPMAAHPLLQVPLPYQSHPYSQIKLTPQQAHAPAPTPQQLQSPVITYPHAEPVGMPLKESPLPQLGLLSVQTKLQQPFQAQPQQGQLYPPFHPPRSQLGTSSYQMPPPVAYFPPHSYYYGMPQQTPPPKHTPYLTPQDHRNVKLPQYPQDMSPMSASREKDEKKEV